MRQILLSIISENNNVTIEIKSSNIYAAISGKKRNNNFPYFLFIKCLIKFFIKKAEAHKAKLQLKKKQSLVSSGLNNSFINKRGIK